MAHLDPHCLQICILTLALKSYSPKTVIKNYKSTAFKLIIFGEADENYLKF